MLRIEALSAGYGGSKSTHARAVSGLLAARAGRILFDGRAIERLGPRARVALGIAHVPEGR